MKAGVHCSHPTGWLANPPRNGAVLGAQRWPLRVLCRGGRQICFVEGECVASFPAAKAILQAPGYPTDTHGMGHLVHLITESLLCSGSLWEHSHGIEIVLTHPFHPERSVHMISPQTSPSAVLHYFFQTLTLQLNHCPWISIDLYFWLSRQPRKMNNQICCSRFYILGGFLLPCLSEPPLYGVIILQQSGFG